jgi:hypothetical protein
MKAVRYRVEVHHSSDCSQCQRFDGEPPDFLFTGEYEERDRSGRTRRGHKRFLVVKCNSINCSARVLVSEEDLLALLRPALSRVSR